MKTRKWMLLPILAVLTAALLAVWLLQPFGYHRILEANWKLDLPAGYTERYGVSEAGFHGDGLRYHVLVYRKAGAEEMNRIFFGSEPGTDTAGTADRVNAWLTALEVPAAEAPAYETCVILSAKQTDGSEAVLLWDAGARTLYAAESFY